jgi:AcrR family transcriptional regulator
MRKNAGQVCRSRGRPQIRPDDETRRLITDAARQAFLASGYAATSMAAVAQRAGVSTRTMYRLIPTKEKLFHGVVAARIGRFMLALDLEAMDRLPLDAALERMLTAYGELTLDAESIAVLRLVLAESPRFPELAAAFSEAAIEQVANAMAAWLVRQRERGLVAFPELPLAVEFLQGMMIMEPQRGVMLGRRAAPGPDEIASRARSCARLFLDGCRIADQ